MGLLPGIGGVPDQKQVKHAFRLVYTSDFMSLPEIPEEIVHPDYLILQCSRLNEPVKNTPPAHEF